MSQSSMKTPSKKLRRNRKDVRPGPSPDNLLSQVVRSIRTVNYTTNPSVNGVVYGYFPELTDIGASAEFYDLFMFYRIDRIDFKLTLVTPSSNTSAVVDVTFNPLNTSVISYGAMLQHPSFRRFIYSDAVREHNWSFVPVPHIQMAGTGSSPAQKPTWLTCTNASLQHYGANICPNGLTGTEYISITARYHLSFKGFH